MNMLIRVRHAGENVVASSELIAQYCAVSATFLEELEDST
jgi:hypothetical protein